MKVLVALYHSIRSILPKPGRLTYPCLKNRQIVLIATSVLVFAGITLNSVWAAPTVPAVASLRLPILVQTSATNTTNDPVPRATSQAFMGDSQLALSNYSLGMPGFQKAQPLIDEVTPTNRKLLTRPAVATPSSEGWQGEQLIPALQATDVFTAVAHWTLSAHNGGLSPAAVIDPKTRVAYFTGSSGGFGIVKRMRLDRFTEMSSILIPSTVAVGVPVSAVVDPPRRYAYFGMSTAPGQVVRMNLDQPNQFDALTLPSGEDYLTSAVIDLDQEVAYFGTSFDDERSQIIKIDLKTFKRVDSLPLSLGEKNLKTALIEPSGANAYFVTDINQVVKIDLESFNRVDERTPTNQASLTGAAVIDNDYAYFWASSCEILRLKLSSFEWDGNIPLKQPEDCSVISSAVINPLNGFAYFGTRSTRPNQVVKVDLKNSMRVDSTSRENPNHLITALIEPTEGYAYFATEDHFVLKVDLGRPSPSSLRIAKTVSSPTALPNDTLTYTVTLTATGLTTTTATLTDTLPAGLTYVPSSITGGATFAPPNQIRFTDPLTPGNPVTITYRATVSSNVTPGSILYNEVKATAAGQLFEASAGVAIPSNTSLQTLNLIYASGDNDLANDMYQLINKAEREAGNPNVVTLMILDGPNQDDSYLYRLQPDQDMSCPNEVNPTCNRYIFGQTIRPWGENVGNPYSLAEFLKGAIRAYPKADKVLLSLVGHGGGWSPELLGGQPSKRGGQPSKRGGQPLDEIRQASAGMLWDDHRPDSISTAALADALRWTEEATGKQIDLLYLDACLMAMSEVAYEVRDNVGYLLGSESWSWTSFSYDAHLRVLNEQPELTVEEIGAAWLENEAGTLEEFKGYPFTYSLIDLNQMEALLEAENNFATVLSETLTIDATAKNKIDQAFMFAECFDSNQDGKIEHGQDNYCDLASFAREIEIQFPGNTEVVAASQALQLAVGEVVKTEKHQAGIPWLYSEQKWDWGGENNLGGVSKYLPLMQDDWKRLYHSGLFLPALDTASLWDDFLEAYWQYQPASEQEPICPSEGCDTPPGSLPLASIVTTVKAGKNAINISWGLRGKVDDLDRLQLLRQTNGGGFNSIGADLLPSNTLYTDSGPSLIDGNEYCYQVKAISNTGQIIDTVASNINCTRFGVLSLEIPDWLGEPGSDIMVPISIGNTQGLCMARMKITIGYDPGLLKLNNKFILEAFDGGQYSIVTDPLSHQVTVSADRTPCQQPGSGPLLYIGFEVLTNNSNQNSALTFISGVDKTAIYHNNFNTSPLPLELNNGTVSTHSKYWAGNVNGDNQGIQDADAATVLKFSTQSSTPLSLQRKACNINGNDSCDSGDANLLRCFANNQDWKVCLNSNSTTGSSVPTLSAQDNIVQLAIGQVAGLPGQIVTIPVAIANGPEFAGGDFSFIYDPNKMTVQDAVLTSLTHEFLIESYVQEPGLLKISLSSNRPINDAGDIFNLKFKVNTKDATVTFGDVYLYDAFGRDLRTSTLRKTITVVPYPGSGTTLIYLPIIRK